MVTNAGASQIPLRAGSVFGAIADPTRRAILDLLREQPLRAGDLAARFAVSRPAIAKHVRVLRKAGLLSETREGTARIYALAPLRLAEVEQWLAPYRLFWGARLAAPRELVENPREDPP